MIYNDIPPGEEAVSDTLNGIANLYKKNLADYGSTSKSVGWKDENSQRLRFEKLLQIVNVQPSREGISVNDLGCGYGALFRFLREKHHIAMKQYYGYDISLEMLQAAESYVADDRALFIQSSRVVHRADYSFVSGTFNVKLEANDELWTEYIKEMLMDLADKSLRGLAFNLLTTYVDWKQENLYYADPFMFFDFCKRHISRYVSLLHDYPLFEWTMLIRKEGDVA